MLQTTSNFDTLEKQLAKDALEKALKDLHGEITREIERNKMSFSDEIKKSLTTLNETIEKHISDEIDCKLPILLATNFSNISEQVKSSFNEMISPVVSKAEQNMKNLESQGEKTLQSWGNMIKKYEGLWTRPFIIMFGSSVLTGTLTCLILFFLKTSYITYAFMDIREREDYEQKLHYIEVREKARAEKEEQQAMLQGVENLENSTKKKKKK